jgi:hypothetical protein
MNYTMHCKLFQIFLSCHLNLKNYCFIVFDDHILCKALHNNVWLGLIPFSFTRYITDNIIHNDTLFFVMYGHFSFLFDIMKEKSIFLFNHLLNNSMIIRITLSLFPTCFDVRIFSTVFVQTSIKITHTKSDHVHFRTTTRQS